MGLLKLLSANEIVAQLVNFLLLLFLLRIFVWKRVLGVLDERKARIAAEFKHIEDSKANLATLKSEYEAKTAAIEDMARKKIEEAAAQANQITQEIKKQAHIEAQGIIDEARETTKYELSKAKVELKGAIIDLAIGAAEHVIEEKFSSQGDRRLVEDFLEKLDKGKAV